jgi:hypothetical protein
LDLIHQFEAALKDQGVDCDGSSGFETVGTVSWEIKFRGEYAQLNQPGFAEDFRAFVRDLEKLCGDKAAISKLTKGSIIAHITSPLSDFKRVQATFTEQGLSCDKLEAECMPVCEWALVDTKNLSKLAKYFPNLREIFARPGKPWGSTSRDNAATDSNRGRRPCQRS